VTIVAVVRALAAKVVPAPAKRALAGFKERRHDRALAPIAERYIDARGLEVTSGPFAGMQYPRRSAQVAKLTGAYELELHHVLRDWIDLAPALIVDIGCGEGYYAVGFAHAIPQAQVRAYDIDPRSRELCGELVALNGVGDRVVVGERCDLATLRRLPASGTALFLDCEGCELELLRPDEVPQMAAWHVLVELHDFLTPETTETIAGRFADTHQFEVIEPEIRSHADIPELAEFSPSERAVALDEFRPARMRWAHLRPRTSWHASA
jgi:SAM-dependent methyltransferase